MSEYSIGAFCEAVLIVKDIQSRIDFYVKEIGWQQLEPVTTCDALKAQWQLDDKAQVSHCLVGEKGSTTGHIRLVEVSGLTQQEQVYIRPNTQIWDTGAIYDLNTRVKDSFALSRHLHEHGWFGQSEPVEMVFGDFKVYEWLARGHDGITFALIERLNPPLPDDGRTSRFSPIFNSSVVVRDYDEEVDFYERTLGFDVLVKQHGTFDKATPNVFAMPLNLVDKTPHHLTMLAPQEEKAGGVEICHFPELAGNDFSQRAQPPNIGIVTLRFPVSGIEKLKQRLLAHNIHVIQDGYLTLPHYGNVRLLSARTPNNNWIEFFEQHDSSDNRSSTG